MSGRDTVNEMRARGDFAKPAGRSGGLDFLLLAMALFAVSCCAFLGLGWLVTKPGSNGDPSRPALVAQTASPMERWTERDTVNCQAIARRAISDSRAAAAASLGLPSVTRSGYAGMAARITCLARTKPTRLCDPEEKATFVAAVNDYVSRLDVVLIGLKAQAGLVGAAAGVLGGEVGFGSAVLDVHTAATVDYIKIYHGDVTRSLRALAQGGVLTTGDFAGIFGASGTIADILDPVSPSHRLCA